jgi:hypothetical protein
MPIVAPLVSAALAIGVIAGTAVTTQNWSQQRSAALYAEIDADIEKTMRQHELRKEDIAARPPATAALSPEAAASLAKADSKSEAGTGAKIDAKARKAKIGSLRKRSAGHRRERLVPPDFARLPISVMRSAIGMWR